MICEKNGELAYFTAENISASHCFTTRLGGVSRGYLSSLNLGMRRGDDPENVFKNYEILANALDFDVRNVVLTHQTHTDIVLPVDGNHVGAGLFAPELPECDGLITNTPGVTLVVFTADCTPILLHDPVTGAVGAVHAGWRGTAAGIAEKAVKAMQTHYGCQPENICAAIGPNIKPCCFETDKEVPDALVNGLGTSALPHILQKGEKYFPNLTAINEAFLRRAGVERIETSPLCTKCHPELFWSARVHGNARGSQGAIIQRSML